MKNIAKEIMDATMELINAEKISSCEQFEMYVLGYRTGKKDQMAEEDNKLLDIWIDGYINKSFYFTFGECGNHPFKEGHLIVRAKNRDAAKQKFNEYYGSKNGHTGFLYKGCHDQKEWLKILEAGYHKGEKPIETIR